MPLLADNLSFQSVGSPQSRHSFVTLLLLVPFFIGRRRLGEKVVGPVRNIQFSASHGIEICGREVCADI